MITNHVTHHDVVRSATSDAPVSAANDSSTVVVIDAQHVPPVATEGLAAVLETDGWTVLRQDVVTIDSLRRASAQTGRVVVLGRTGIDEVLAAVQWPSLLLADGSVDVLASLDAGYRGILSWDDSLAALCSSVESVRLGAVVISERFARRLLTDTPVSPTADRLATQLTEREMQVVGLIANGLTHREIAGELNLSPSTIDTYTSRIRAKTGTRGTAELTRI